MSVVENGSDTAPTSNAAELVPAELDILKMQKVFDGTLKEALHCSAMVENLTEKIKAEDAKTGLGILNMKNHLMVDYLTNLLKVILSKSTGGSIAGNPAVQMLVKIRKDMEEIRPMEYKLQYQIEKLLKATTEGRGNLDPLQFKANPDELDQSDDSDEESEEESKEEVKKKSEVYRPPKVVPQHFNEEPENEAKKLEKVKRKTINRDLIRELQEEFLDTPVEVHNMGDGYDKQLSKEIIEKERYEEMYMTRLPVSKQEKHKQNKMSTLGVLGDELTYFSTRRSSGPSSGSSKSKKRKQGSKGKKEGKKKFRK